MLVRALPLLILLALPAIVVSQDRDAAPQQPNPLRQVAPQPAAAEKQEDSEQELQRLIASRDALTQEIQRLSQVTGQHQHVVVSVQVCDLSLTKVRSADFKVEGVNLETLRADGFAAALSDGALDPPDLPEEIRRVPSRSGAPYRVVLESDERLKKLVAELQKSGALKILAEPTLTTVSGRPATWLSGGECPIPTTQPNGDTTIQLKAFGTQLYVFPTVLSQSRVRLQVRPEISEMDFSHSVKVGDRTTPAFHVRYVDTNVEMNFGETFVLSGLRQKRAIPQAREESAETDQAKQPSPKEFELTQLIVLVRAEMLDAPLK